MKALLHGGKKGMEHETISMVEQPNQNRGMSEEQNERLEN